MTMVPVVSSNLESVGYDATTQTLRVSFIGGGIYDYHQVPPHHHQGLMNANSKGEYLDAHIKKGGYRFTKIR